MSKLLRCAALALALSAMALPAMAADAPAGGDPVLARVNGAEIHRSDIAREMMTLGPQAQQMPMQMLYPQLLEKAVVTKLLATQGYKDKLDATAEVKQRVKDAESQIVADAYVHKMVQPKLTDSAVKSRYDELVKKFKPEDEVRARHILVPTEAEADDILKQLKDGADFAKLATEKSKDTGSAKQGGDLGYFTKAVMVKPFADAVFAMKTGELSEKPVKTDFGYHIIKVEDRRKSSPPPMAEVKEQIMNQLGQELASKMIKDIQDKAKIERFNLDGSPMKAPAEDKKSK